MCKKVLVKSFLVSLVTFLLAACGNNLEGKYKIVEGLEEHATVTLGEKNFAFSTGARGTYEVSGDEVIFSGLTFSGTMKIENGDLVNDKWRFSKTK